MKIGGNTTIKIQTLTTSTNSIGEHQEAWADAFELIGWLDFSSGDSKYSTYNAKIQESTHVFICDYKALTGVRAENCRLVDEDGLIYDVLLIDDPMRMHYQLEIFLKFTGGQ